MLVFCHPVKLFPDHNLAPSHISAPEIRWAQEPNFLFQLSSDRSSKPGLAEAWWPEKKDS